MNRKLAGSLIVLLCVVLVPTLSGTWPQDPDEVGVKCKAELCPTSLPAPYQVQPNDLLEIFVWKEADLTRSKVLVRPDGRISFPLIQDMPAAGLTPGELKDEIEKRLKEFLDAPNVT